MPKMGISVSEGTVVEWRKKPGDWVEADETICDVTTDKIDVEIPAPAAGRLLEILVEAGTTVDVGDTIARIDAAAIAGEAHPDEHEQEPAAEAPSERGVPGQRRSIDPASSRPSSSASPRSTRSISAESRDTGSGGGSASAI